MKETFFNFVKTAIQNLKIFVFKLIVPKNKRIFYRFYYKKLLRKIDLEINFVNNLLTKRRRFIDVGANYGIYSFIFSKSFEVVDSFEPIKFITQELQDAKISNINIHNIALSDNLYKKKFYIPCIKNKFITGLSSFRKEKNSKEILVQCKKLDDFNFTDVDLIKIDIEGFEYEFLQGAINTLIKNKPIIIIENEIRHAGAKAIKVFKLLDSWGYKGFFVDRKKLLSLDYFSFDLNQRKYVQNTKSKKYVNNFIFVPNKSLSSFI